MAGPSETDLKMVSVWHAGKRAGWFWCNSMRIAGLKWKHTKQNGEIRAYERGFFVWVKYLSCLYDFIKFHYILSTLHTFEFM